MTDGPQYPQYPEYPDQPSGGDSPAPGQQPPAPPPQQPPPSYGSVPQPPPPASYGQAPYGQPAYGQAPYGQPNYGSAPQPYPGYGLPPTRTNQMAVWAMVVGIISIIFCYVGLVLGPVAIGLAVSARRQIAERRGAETGDGMALAGLITGIIGTVIWGAVLALIIIGFSTSP